MTQVLDQEWQQLAANAICHAADMAANQVHACAADVAHQHMRPSVVFRPELHIDGDQWCALYGRNLVEGVAGFGDTAKAAMLAFDKAWQSGRPPQIRKAAAPTQQQAEELRQLGFCLDHWASEARSGGLYEAEANHEHFAGVVRKAADRIASLPSQAPDALDAARYRWLIDNSFDREGRTQLHVWMHTWEPHSQTGAPTEWKCRVRGPAIDRAIDAAMGAATQKDGA